MAGKHEKIVNDTIELVQSDCAILYQEIHTTAEQMINQVEQTPK